MVNNGFWNMSDDDKKNPECLKKALEEFEAIGKLANPISYALEGALTDENIDLALKKGKIIIIPKSAVANCRKIILALFRHPDYVSKYPYLSDELKSDPEILRQALLAYDCSLGKHSPISYAFEGALTDENIDLALEKGDIDFPPGSPLLNNRYFVIEAFKRRLYFSQYNNISDILKNDPEVIAITTSELDHMYKYNCSSIVFLPNGDFKEEEVKGKNNDDVPKHTIAINKIIKEFCEKYNNDSYLCDLKNELKTITHPSLAAKKCNDYEILIVIILNKECMFFCPDELAIEQFEAVQSFIEENYECFECSLSHCGEVFLNLSKEEILINLSEWKKVGYTK